MTEDIGYDQVRDWLDEDIPLIDTIERVTDRNVDYKFLVHQAGLSVNVIKAQKQGPIMLAGRVQVHENSLDHIRDSRWLQFVGEINSILTTAPGMHSFVDGHGNHAPSDRFQAVEIRYWIYPDGASQHVLMNGITDIFAALSYIRDTVNRINEEVTNAR